MTDRREALEQILNTADRHGLTLAEITEAFSTRGLDRGEATEPGHKRNLVAKVFGYLGGIFVFAGIATLIAMQWEHLTSPARIIITFGSGFALFGMALAALRDDRYRVAATPLFLAAAVLEPTGMLVTFREYGGGGNPLTAVLWTTAAVSCQYGVLFWRAGRTVLLFVALFFATAFVWSLFERVEMDGAWSAVVVGCSLLLIIQRIRSSHHRAIAPFWDLVAAVHLFAGAFEALEGSVFELAYLGLGCLMIFVSVICHSRTLLGVSTVAMLCYIAHFSSEQFVDVVGWPITLILFGLVMIGLGGVALRIDRAYLKDARP